MQESHLTPSCVPGLRVAADAIFQRAIESLWQLPTNILLRFTLPAVMHFLAAEQHALLNLSPDSVVLQLLTVDKLQLVPKQAQESSMHLDVVNAMVDEIGRWMMQGRGSLSACT